MNVLLVAEYYWANPPFVHLSKELAKRKNNITVVTSFRTLDKQTIEEDVQIFKIKPLITIYKIPRALTFPFSKICHIVKNGGIDIIHAPNDHSTNVATAALVAKATNKPFVYTIQGPGTKTGHLLVDLLARMYNETGGRWLAREARKIILLSKSLFSTAEKLRIERSKIVVIPSGVDSAYFNPERPEVKEKASQIMDGLTIGNEIIVGYMGRLYPAKGLTYLFSAVERIQDKHPNIALLVVGDGAQRNELEAMSKKLKVRTIFTGWQRDIVPYYSLMDIFVLPSLFEGLPNVILEAMAMRKAIIATKVGGIPDVLSDGESGLLVPVRNVQRLAFALEKLIEDDNLRAKIGAVNRQKVEEHFQWSKTVEKIERVYKEIA